MDANEREAIIKRVRERVEAELRASGANPNALGRIHRIDARMKEILKEEYDIDYVTAAEQEPDMMID